MAKRKKRPSVPPMSSEEYDTVRPQLNKKDPWMQSTKRLILGGDADLQISFLPRSSLFFREPSISKKKGTRGKKHEGAGHPLINTPQSQIPTTPYQSAQDAWLRNILKYENNDDRTKGYYEHCYLPRNTSTFEKAKLKFPKFLGFEKDHPIMGKDSSSLQHFEMQSISVNKRNECVIPQYQPMNTVGNIAAGCVEPRLERTEIVVAGDNYQLQEYELNSHHQNGRNWNIDQIYPTYNSISTESPTEYVIGCEPSETTMECSPSGGKLLQDVARNSTFVNPTQNASEENIAIASHFDPRLGNTDAWTTTYENSLNALQENGSCWNLHQSDHEYQRISAELGYAIDCEQNQTISTYPPTGGGLLEDVVWGGIFGNKTHKNSDGNINFQYMEEGEQSNQPTPLADSFNIMEDTYIDYPGVKDFQGTNIGDDVNMSTQDYLDTSEYYLDSNLVENIPSNTFGNEIVVDHINFDIHNFHAGEPSSEEQSLMDSLLTEEQDTIANYCFEHEENKEKEINITFWLRCLDSQINS